MTVQRKSNITIIVILILFNFIVYFNSIKNGFVWDDAYLVRDNYKIRDIKNIKELLMIEDAAINNPNTGYYRPLINLTYLIDYQIFKGNAYGFRLTNIAFNILSVIILFLLALSITKDRILSFAAAVIFSAQTVHVEAVSFIAGRNNVICTLFILISLYDYIMCVKHGKKSYFICSMIFLFLGAASKEFAYMLPFIFILFDYSFDEDFSIKKGIKRYAAAFSVVLAFIILKSVMVPLGSSFVLESEELYHRVLTTLPIMFRYLASQIVPYNLSIYFGIPLKETFFDISVIASFLFFAALTTVLIRYIKKYRLLFFSFFTYIILLSPVANIIKIPGALMADRWLYPASAAFSLFFAGLISLTLSKKRGLIPITVIAVVIFLSVFTINRNKVFKNDFSLFYNSVQTNPKSAALRTNLGRQYRIMGDYDNAEKQYLLAIEYEPDYYLSYNNLSIIYDIKNEDQKALEVLKKSYMLKPEYPLTSYNLGVTYSDLGDIKMSNKFYNIAILLNPELYNAYFNLASNYYKQGKYELAVENLQKIVNSSPDENEKKEASRRIRIIREKIKTKSLK